MATTKLLTAREVADMLGLHPITVYLYGRSPLTRDAGINCKNPVETSYEI